MVDEGPTASILISVPKKRFKRAVKRNRVKRQVREAYRLQKQLLIEPLEARGLHVLIAFIWLDSHLHPSLEVHAKVRKLLLHIVDKCENA
jgi:ribonuclease P protein component